MDAITIINGKAQFAYAAGVKPWHGMGQELTADAPISVWIEEAGFNYTLLRAAVRYPTSRADANDPSTWRRYDDKVVIFRDDNFAPMGVVGDNFKIFQPARVVESFQRIAEKTGATLHTLGNLFGGKKYWALAKTALSSNVVDSRDTIERYMLISTAADGSAATEWRETDICVVCWNTLSAAIGGSKAKARKTHRSYVDLDEIERDLGLNQDGDSASRFDAAMAEFRKMAETPLGEGQLIAATADLFRPGWRGMDQKEQNKLMTKPSSPIRAVAELAIDRKAIGSNLDGRTGTAWAWLNAVTEHVDHHARSRSDDNRLNSAWFGAGDAIKDKAREMAVEMVTANGESRTVYQSVAIPVAPAGLLDIVLDVTAAL